MEHPSGWNPLGNRFAAFEVRLELLRNDHTSASLALAHRAIDLAKDWIESGAHPKTLARELSSMHPGIALIANVARMLEGDDRDRIQSLTSLRRSLLDGNRVIAERLAEIVPRAPVVITLSNSGTVRDALARLGCRIVYVLESRPGAESGQMVKKLRPLLSQPDKEAEIHLIEATTIGNVIPHVDCAIVGTDAVNASAILHKVGTLPLALCCRHFQKPFYALGHSLKQVDHGFEAIPRTNGAVETQIFDVTPRELVTQVVTERTESVGTPSRRNGMISRQALAAMR